MKLIILILSLFVAGIFCDIPVECYFREIEKCDESLFPTEIPKTVEELKKDCKNLVTYGKCSYDVQELCGEDTDELAKIQYAISFIEETCQQEGHIFKVVARNLDCVVPAFITLDATCSFESLSKENYMAVMTKTEELTGGSENEELFDCLNDFLYNTCKSVVLGEKCGDETQSVFVEIMANMDLSFGKCIKEFPEEWEALREVFETVIHEELRMIKRLEERRR